MWVLGGLGEGFEEEGWGTGDNGGNGFKVFDYLFWGEVANRIASIKGF